MMEHDTRYEYATEWVEIVEKLWDRAVVRLRGQVPHGQAGLRRSETVRETAAVLISAGSSGKGREFAAKYCDINFSVIEEEGLDKATAWVKEMKKLAYDNYKREIGTFTYSYAVVRNTEKEAKEYWDYYVNQKGDWEAADNICKVFGVESGSYSPDYMDKFRRNFIAGWGGYPLVGTPEQVADRIVEVSKTGVDGSLITMVDYNQELPYFNAKVLPLLEQAGLRKPRAQAITAAPRGTARALTDPPRTEARLWPRTVSRTRSRRWRAARWSSSTMRTARTNATSSSPPSTRRRRRSAFMVRHTSGVLCVGLPSERLDELALPLMVERNTESMQTAYTVTVDLRRGTSTGISAADRAATIHALVDPSAVAGDFNRPGHVFPLRAVSGGVLRRPGHTEAAVDLSRLAGLRPGGVLAEIVNDDGSMARRPPLEAFARRHGLLIISIADLFANRQGGAKVKRESAARLPTRHGVFRACVYRMPDSPHEHLAMVMGEVAGAKDVLVRVHSECLTGDTFGSLRCDCRQQLGVSLAKVGRAGCGVVLHLRGHDGRGIGLTHKLRAYALQDEGFDAVQANLELGIAVDARDYAVGAGILRELGITSMRLLTNNPAKYRRLSSFGLEIAERVPLTTPPTRENVGYLRTKQQRLGHALNLGDDAATSN